MSKDSAGAITRFRRDLQRPGGGWTVGVVTIGLVLLGPVAGIVTNDFIGFAWLAVTLTIHMAWGAHGYYPRGFN